MRAEIAFRFGFGGCGSLQDFVSFVCLIVGYINLIIPIIIALAVLFFFWGILQYGFSQNEDSVKKARYIMVWGIIILVVMVSIWGILKILARTFLPF